MEVHDSLKLGSLTDGKQQMRLNIGSSSALLVVLVAAGIQSPQAATIQSTFDGDTEGWTITTSNANLSWSNSGGNPGGFIIAEDTAVNNTLIFAPSKFLGNLLDFENGVISFDAIELENVNDPWFRFGEITIVGGAGSATRDLAPDALPSVWTSYASRLTASEWGVPDADWKALLANVTDIQINLESGAFVGDETVGVDNIAISAVPIPAAVWLFASSLIGLIAMLRKKAVRTS